MTTGSSTCHVGSLLDRRQHHSRDPRQHPLQEHETRCFATFSRLSRMMPIITMQMIGRGTCSVACTRCSLISVHLLPDLGSGVRRT